MIASKGFLGAADPDPEVDLLKSVVEDDRRSVALMPSPEEELAWTWEAAYRLNVESIRGFP